MFGQAHPSPSLLGEIFEVFSHVGEPLALGEVDKDSRSSFPLPVPTDGAVAVVALSSRGYLQASFGLLLHLLELHLEPWSYMAIRLALLKFLLQPFLSCSWPLHLSW